ncbi:autotransporter domain-containing protein [Xanthobacter sp. KR7-65]|uniref:autotransporter domain-containing protein n=1 Tax=Xanthobacter sp. KR7-65 TaxID=3156612 RepID=UPI0032B3A2CB
MSRGRLAASFRIGAVCSTLASPLPALAQSPTDWETPEYFRSGALAQINASGAYAQGYTGAGVMVGVADSGLDTTHPEFAGHVLPGFDFRTNAPLLPGQNDDTDGHGTHVSGIVGAARDGHEMQGVAFGASIIPTALGATASPSFDNYISNPWPFLAAQGVSIINASYRMTNCGYAKDDCSVTDFTRAQIEASFPHTVERALALASAGVLMVVASGNDGLASPDPLPGLPYLFPELKDTWLTVGAVDANNVIWSDSNRCGVAKDWCLVAPGVNIYSTTPNGTYKPLSGTSQAAPVVSGVAALVKEAYPWMTGHDLQQTLLTTATDLGASGVDEIYGWGLVNAEKAVRGYGMFTTTTILDTKGYTSTFSNDISGAGALVKAGEGTLILSGANTYAGGSVVAGGTLAITGSVTSQVTVLKDGTVAGTGHIGTGLFAEGTIAPGWNGPGTLSISGPVGMTEAATLAVAIDGTAGGTGAGSFSRLAVDGVVVVDGTLAPELRGIAGASNTYVPALGSTYGIISAQGGLAGSFDRLVQPVGLADATRFDAIYGDDTLTLVVTPEAYGALAANGLATTANATALGRALDSVRPDAGLAPADRAGLLFAQLYQVAPSALPAALAQMSGEIHASASAMIFDDARQVRTAVADRLDDGGSRPAMAAAVAPGWNLMLWASGYGGWSDASGAGAAQLDWTQGGFVAGADIGLDLGDTTRLGIAAGAGRSSGSLDALGASADNDHQDLAVYGSTRVGSLALKYGGAWSWNQLATSRAISVAPFAQVLTADYDGTVGQVFGEAAYDLAFGAFKASPFVGLAYLHQDFNGFVEQGGTAALSGAPAALDTTLATLGVRLSTDFALGAGTLTPRLTLGWQHAMGDVDTAAVLTIAGSAPFAAAGVPLARDALLLNAGLAYRVSETVTAEIAYDGLIADNAQSSAVRGSLRMLF